MGLELIGLAIWAITAFGCVAEIFYERDWPRETFKWFALATVGMIVMVIGLLPR